MSSPRTRGMIVLTAVAVATASLLAAETDPPLTSGPPTSPVGHHEERARGPYVAVPPSARRIGPAARPVRGKFVSVQVNVDAGGNNILGDAANEPSLAVDPGNPDAIAVGWRQFDTIASSFRQAGVSHSTDGGATWSAGRIIEPGIFRSDPVLGASADGAFYYYSLRGNFLCDAFISFDGGETWSASQFAFGGDKAWMAVDATDGPGAGNIYVAWSTAGNPHSPNQFTRSTNGGTQWMSPIELIDPVVRWGTLAVASDGTLYVSGIGTDGNWRILRSSNAWDAGQTPTWDLNAGVDLGGSLSSNGGPNPGGLLAQNWIDVDRSDGPYAGAIYMLASIDPTGSDPLDVMIARSDDRGATWNPPVRVNDDGFGANAWQWFGTMSVAPNGRIDVVWNDTRNSQQVNISELYYAFSEDGGATFSENFVVTPPYDSWVGWPQQNKMGDYYHMVSDDSGAGLIYAATFNGEQDVYYVRLEPPVCADLTGDRRVTFDDVVRLLSAWGPCSGCPEDLTGDGVVDVADIIALLAGWGACTVGCCLPADACDDAPVVGDGSYGFSTLTATTDGPDVPASCEEGEGLGFLKDVWIRYAPECDGIAIARLCDSAYDTRVAVYADDGCPGTVVACNDDACGDEGTRSYTTFPVSAGSTYLVRIGSRVTTGRGILTLSCIPE